MKDSYKDINDYIGTFEPLLFEEVKAQIVQGRDEEDGILLNFLFLLFFLLYINVWVLRAT